MNHSATTQGEALTRRDLIAYLESGCKPRSAWRIGTEHEKFGHRLADHAPLPYEGRGASARSWRGFSATAGNPTWRRATPSPCSRTANR